MQQSEDFSLNGEFTFTFVPDVLAYPPVLADPQSLQDLLGISNEELEAVSSQPNLRARFQ
jgi:hypothetical protein